MPLISEHLDSCELDHLVRGAHAVTAELISDVIGKTCRRFSSMARAGKTARIEQLIGSGAWIDAVLALVQVLPVELRIVTVLLASMRIFTSAIS